MVVIYTLYSIATLILLHNAKEIDWLDADSDTLADLPTNIQIALAILETEGLDFVSNSTLPSTQIYYGLVKYFQSDWDKCEWVENLFDDADYVTSDQWDNIEWMEPANGVVTNGQMAWCEIEETLFPFSMSDVDHFAPKALKLEIRVLLQNNLQCIAKWKYQVWEAYNYTWDPDFVAALGVNGDLQFFGEFKTQLDSVFAVDTDSGSGSGSGSESGEKYLSAHAYQAGNHKSQTNQNGNGNGNGNGNAFTTTHFPFTPSPTHNPGCDIPDPIVLLDPYLNITTDVFAEIFGNSMLAGSSMCAAVSWCIEICAADEVQLCLGGCFGMLGCADGNGCVFRESTVDIEEEEPNFSDGTAKMTIELSFYDSIDAVYEAQWTSEIGDNGPENDGDWLGSARTIYNLSNYTIGVRFSGEVSADGTITNAQNTKGSSMIDCIAWIDFKDEPQFFWLNEEASTSHAYNYNWFLLIGTLIVVAMLMIMAGVKIKRKYYPGFKEINDQKSAQNNTHFTSLQDCESTPLIH